MSEQRSVVRRAEDVAPVLREGVALLPGCRDRHGRALIFIPSKEQAINGDVIRNVLLYLHTVTADDARDKGFVLVIDMRGKQTWNNVRPILKVISQLCNVTTVHIVLILKPDKFWEKQKAQISLGSWNFEVQMIGADQLTRYVDVTQVPRELGGSYPYNHDEWLHTRLNLEKWIWQVSDIMQGLEQHRSAVCEADHPVDVAAAKKVIDTHNIIKQKILTLCPIDALQEEANKISFLIKNPQSGVSNPDLISALPYMATLITSCADLKNKVFKTWQKKQEELDAVYQYKLYENDVGNVLDWIRVQTSRLMKTMGDVGTNEAEACDRLRAFDESEKAVKNYEVSISQMLTVANRLKSTGGTPQHRNRIDRSASQIREEWERLNIFLKRRRGIITSAVAFFRCSGQYFSKYKSWLDRPGCDPAVINAREDAQLNTAIDQHENFWTNVETIYAEAISHGSQLNQALKIAETEDLHGVAREQIQRLTRAQKQLHEIWRERKVKLHSMLALTAFHTDTDRVIEWLDKHGDTYLMKNTKIGDSVESAKALHRNHQQFCRIAENTFANAKKLFEASNMIKESGVADLTKMEKILDGLQARLRQFTNRIEIRKKLLDSSMLFHIHFNELMEWFSKMQQKYNDRIIASDDVNDCELATEAWMLESDGTAQAYATAMGEGTDLINELRAQQPVLEVDYSSSVAHISQLMNTIDLENKKLMERWSMQRHYLLVSVNYARFIRDNTEVLAQIENWEEDMRGMLQSPTFLDNAAKVEPYHIDNMQKVKVAIANIKALGQELFQDIRGNRLEDLKTADGHIVIGVIRDTIKLLDKAERQVFEVASNTTHRIEAALKFSKLKHYANDLVRTYEKLEQQMFDMGGIPETWPEATQSHEAHQKFRERLTIHDLNKSEKSHAYYALSKELVSSNMVDRTLIVQLNEWVIGQWRRLVGLTDERQKMLVVACTFFKTCEQLSPILENLEKDYSGPTIDFCTKCPSSDPKDRLDFLAEQLSLHEEKKERLLKGFSYAQKTSESFLKYIQRVNSNVYLKQKESREQLVLSRKAQLRDRQSHIYQLWTAKKRNLERCHQYVLLEMSQKDILGWIQEDGSKQLARFQAHARTMAAGQKEAVFEEFSKFKIAVKEKRANIQMLLGAGDVAQKEASEHKADIERLTVEIRDRFEQFSRSVADCEAALRGGRPAASRDELSLDRHSDASVGERMDAVGSAVSKEMKKMREPVEELIQTERTYVNDLNQCVQIYIGEFDRAAAGLPLSLRGRRKDIFGNIEKIASFHSDKFLNELEKYKNDPEGVGCSFTVWVDYMNELYTEYCVNMEKMSREVMDMPETIQYFAGVKEKHKIETLASMLIKPVQRITRYGLMMEKLLKMTEALRGESSGAASGNVEAIRDAYDIVLSIPKRANDLIHLHCLEKEKLGVLGPFVMQDTLTVWEPKSYFKKGKERQVFLFELAIVIAKKADMPSKNVRYFAKGKPMPLSAINVVEHVESDVCRFGLRVGDISSNDNRFDLKANKESDKIAWVRKIRELTQGLLSLGSGVSWDAGSRTSSKVSSSSGDRFSRDADSLSLEGQRHSMQSCTSSEGASDQWVISSDFEATAQGQLTVRRGERVEILDQQPTDTADWLSVVVTDEPQRTGLVPYGILLPDQPSSSTDRPDTSNGSSVVKRKSLRESGRLSTSESHSERQEVTVVVVPGFGQPGDTRMPCSNLLPRCKSSIQNMRRIFANSGKEQKNSVASSVGNATAPSTQDPSVAAGSTTTTTAAASNQTLLPAEVPVIVSSAPDTTPADDEPLEGLPPPMEELSLNSAATHMNEETAEQSSIREEEDAPKAEEKSPEEVARFKRHYVLMELVETEKDYVKDLASVVDGYIANLEQMELPDELKGKDKIIFANINQILEFHRTSFLKEIEKCLENYEAAGSAFVKYQRRLDALYVKYCQNKPKSDYLVSQDEFEVFFAETKLKLGHKVALSDLLIKPVQRIMKYQLLLKDILKFTERAKESTETLKKALEVMHVVPKACDDMMQVGRLQNFDGNLTAQGRLIYQGTLSIAETMGSNTQKAKDRRIFLFEQSAIIADHIPPKKEFGNPTYIFKNQVMVNKMQFQKNISPDEPLKFIIGSTDPAQPNFLAIAQTQEEKDEWTVKLEEVLDTQKRMLEQLVNPKKYMGGGGDDLGFGGLNLGGGSKAPPRSPAATSKPSTPKPESPKKEKSKLFGFGKKPSAKSPTSP